MEGRERDHCLDGRVVGQHPAYRRCHRSTGQDRRLDLVVAAGHRSLNGGTMASFDRLAYPDDAIGDFTIPRAWRPDLFALRRPVACRRRAVYPPNGSDVAVLACRIGNSPFRSNHSGAITIAGYILPVGLDRPGMPIWSPWRGRESRGQRQGGGSGVGPSAASQPPRRLTPRRLPSRQTGQDMA